MPKSEYKKTLYVRSEQVAAGRWPPSTKPDDIDSVMLSLSHKDGGCKWEFEVELIRLGNKGALRLNLFSDSWIAIKEAPEAFKVFARFQDKHSGDDTPRWPKLLEALEKAGWERFKAEPLEEARPAPCGGCGRDRSVIWKAENEAAMKRLIVGRVREKAATNELDISTELDISVRTAARLVDELITEGRIPATPASKDRK